MRTALIIEDSLEIRENTAEILEIAGYRVVIATNGHEGIALAAGTVPDIILCDIMMPGVNGYDVLTTLKANSVTAQIPFVYVTASAEKKEVKMALDLGADGYISKPFDDEDLMETIEGLLGKEAF